jgi:hypothetical protein
MAEEEDIVVCVRRSQHDEKQMRSVRSTKSSFLRLGKNRSRVKFSIRQKNFNIGDTLVFRTTVLLGTKRLEVFNTSLFLETKVFLKYFKKTELPNGAQTPLLTSALS